MLFFVCLFVLIKKRCLKPDQAAKCKVITPACKNPGDNFCTPSLTLSVTNQKFTSSHRRQPVLLLLLTKQQHVVFPPYKRLYAWEESDDAFEAKAAREEIRRKTRGGDHEERSGAKRGEAGSGRTALLTSALTCCTSLHSFQVSPSSSSGCTERKRTVRRSHAVPSRSAPRGTPPPLAQPSRCLR